MARLALVAMLLLATLPSIGRIVQSQRADGIGPYWAAICTMAGLQQADPLRQGAIGTPATPQPADPHGAAPDCAYCPLLVAVVVAILWLALAWRSPARLAPPALPDVARRKAAHPCGLGSRGPPLVL